MERQRHSFLARAAMMLLLMVLTTVSAWADDSWTSGGCDVILSGSTLTVKPQSDTGAMQNYTSSSDRPWDSQKGNITSIVIGSGVTSIGDYAFSGCSNLATVTVYAPSCTLGTDAFYNCNSLNDIYVFADKVTYYKGATQWSDYSGIIEAIPNSGNCGSTDHESDVKYVLTGTSPNYTLTIMKVGTTGAMADYTNQSDRPWNSEVNNITSVVIEDGVTSIGERAFRNLTKVTTVSFGSDVTTIGKSAFELCNGLTSVTIPASVTNIDNYAFNACENLETVSFGNGVTRIGNYAFQDCKNLTTISFGSGLKTILLGTFQGCTSLSSVNLPASLTNIGSDAFAGCTNLATATLNSNPNIAGDKSPAFDNNTTVKMNLTATVGAAGEYWMTFYNKHNFQVPATGTQIFKAALSEDKLTLRELTTDKIVTNKNAVILKSTTASITLTRTTSDSSNDFSDNSLSGVDKSKGKTVDANQSTTYALNSGTQGVGFYKVPTGNTIGVGNAYVTSTSTSDFLSLVVVSGNCGTTDHESDVTWLYDINTHTLTISGTGPMMYYGSALGSDSKYHSTAPWSHLDSEIEKVIVENGVTYIGSYAFAYCAALTTISLPASVVALGDYVCFTSNVTRIDIPSMTAATLGTDGFEYCLPGLQIAVPADLLKTYQTATNWSTYTAKLVGILSEATGFNDGFATGNYEYTRSFNCGVASTVCLPFSIDDTQTAAAGKFYTFAGVNKTANPWEVVMEEADATANPPVAGNEATTLTANTPYLFVPAATGTVLFHGTVPANVSAGTANSGDWTFIGTYARRQWDDTNNTDEIGSIYGFAAISGTSTDGQNTAINAGSFFRVAGGANSYIVPFRAYMKYTATNAPSLNHAAASDDMPAQMTVRLVGSNGETTAIGTLDTRTGLLSFDNEAWYTLDGRKLDSKPTQKGIYINGGRKVVVR